MNEQSNNTSFSKNDLIAVRSFRESDKAFIMATWLRGLRFGNEWFKLIDNDIYYKIYHEVLETLLSKKTIQIRIACLKDDQEVILGYSVYEGNRLHWFHVKKAWRRIGIGKSLIPDGIKSVSHLTEVGKSIFLKKKLIFNPFLLF